MRMRTAGLLALLLICRAPDLVAQVRTADQPDCAGELSYNQSLSQRRADAVFATLIADFRIAAARLTAIGVGMAAPVANNDGDEGRSRNRRVEIVARVTPGRQ